MKRISFVLCVVVILSCLHIPVYASDQLSPEEANTPGIAADDFILKYYCGGFMYYFSIGLTVEQMLDPQITKITSSNIAYIFVYPGTEACY